MTVKETERLAVVEIQVKDIQADVTEMKGDIKEIKNSMVSRKDVSIFSIALSILVALATYIVIVKG